MHITNLKRKLNWTAKAEERAAQNANNLLQVGFYENAFERTMGNAAVDLPAALYDDISEEVHRNFADFMPEVDIIDIEFETDEKGDAKLEVQISFGEY